uniref:Uncharacterized protein n=1 Tax=Aegilops tauschii subsp. strangulata TaxID=200361 RepID=A0A453RNH5_AEGTS
MLGAARRSGCVLGQLMQTLRPAASAATAARSYSATPKEMTVREALNSALDEEMSADPSVFLMGEEVPRYHLEDKLYILCPFFVHSNTLVISVAGWRVPRCVQDNKGFAGQVWS